MKKVSGTDLIHGDAAVQGGKEVVPSISVTTSKELIASTTIEVSIEWQSMFQHIACLNLRSKISVRWTPTLAILQYI